MNLAYRKISISLLVTGFFIIVTVFLNNTRNESKNHNKISVTASFYPLYFLAEEIGGGKAEIFNITPSGAEPHDYEPTAQDIARIENSRLLILNGAGLEAWGDDIRKNIDSSRIFIVTAGEGLADRQVAEDGENIIDPHIWLSPLLVKDMADKIAAGFIQADPANADYYKANADMLKSRLGDLDNEYRNGLRNCAQNSIVTSHAAFGYLAAAYGFKQVPITGLSPDAEPSPRQLGEVADFARKNHVKYIFFESLVSPKLSETIAREIGAQTLVLNPLEGLSNEELAQGRTYFTEMKNNLANLQIALQCGK